MLLCVLLVLVWLVVLCCYCVVVCFCWWLLVEAHKVLCLWYCSVSVCCSCFVCLWIGFLFLLLLSIPRLVEARNGVLLCWCSCVLFLCVVFCVFGVGLWLLVEADNVLLCVLLVLV